MARCVSAILEFLAPFLKNVQVNDAVVSLYRGTLRVLLVLLHDFSDFLSYYHFEFCAMVPSNCIQLRNLILSAFPGDMKLPDPFTPNLKVDLLPEIGQRPLFSSGRLDVILNHTIKHELERSIHENDVPNFFSGIWNQHFLVWNEANVNFLNCIVFYTGILAVQQGYPGQATSRLPHRKVFNYMANKLDSEGRYYFLNAMVNQLRYPNSHTYYFSCMLLFLFAEVESEFVREQITRVLLERLVVNRPHPWGLLITFIELIKNAQYNFWSHEFTRYTPDLERLFESVARSCVAPR